MRIFLLFFLVFTGHVVVVVFVFTKHINLFCIPSCASSDCVVSVLQKGPPWVVYTMWHFLVRMRHNEYLFLYDSFESWLF